MDTFDAMMERGGDAAIRAAGRFFTKDGLSAPHRLKDLADAQELIRVLTTPGIHGSPESLREG
jgi:hypothetical protein